MERAGDASKRALRRRLWPAIAFVPRWVAREGVQHVRLPRQGKPQVGTMGSYNSCTRGETATCPETGAKTARKKESAALF